jgi:hypothetical protein
MRLLAALLLVPFISFGQAGSEIYLMDLKKHGDEITLSKPLNITNHKGYDNQPYFGRDKAIVYYSSFDDSGRSNIKWYDIRSKKSDLFVDTHEREYSPTITPDGRFISCIVQRDNGNQDLVKWPIIGGDPILMINNVKVGYHAWMNNSEVLLFVLGDSSALWHYNIATKSGKVLAHNIGRSLHQIPGTTLMSFVQKNSGKDWMIKSYDPATGTIADLAPTLSGREDICWLNKETIMMSDSAKIYSFNIVKKKEWTPVTISGNADFLKGVTRLAINKEGDRIAIVVAE